MTSLAHVHARGRVVPRSGFDTCASACQSEGAVQEAIIGYLELVLPHAVIFAIPNASRRTAAGYASNAVRGLLPGIPDLGVVLPGGRVVLIECKSRRGSPSNAQNDMLARLGAMGVPCGVARSVDDARRILAEAGIETREAR